VIETMLVKTAIRSPTSQTLKEENLKSCLFFLIKTDLTV